MIGTIILHDLEVSCIVGIYPKERNIEQLLLLDVEVDYDFSEAARTENIFATLDYTLIAESLTMLLREEKFQLVETAAERCCSLIFEKWPEVERCKLVIKKPGAIEQAKYAAVRIERRVNTYHKINQPLERN